MNIKSVDEKLDQLVSAVQSLKDELCDARKDIQWLKKQAGFGKRLPQYGAIIALPETDEWGEPSIRLNVEQWKKVKRGDAVHIKGSGLWVTDAISYSDYWEFNTKQANYVILKTGLDDDDADIEVSDECELQYCDIKEVDRKKLKELASVPITGNTLTD
jgi:hypothetical protein